MRQPGERSWALRVNSGRDPDTAMLADGADIKTVSGRLGSILDQSAS